MRLLRGRSHLHLAGSAGDAGLHAHMGDQSRKKVDLSKRRAVAIDLLLNEEEKKGHKRRRFGVHKIFKKSNQYGEFHHLFSRLCLDDERF